MPRLQQYVSNTSITGGISTQRAQASDFVDTGNSQRLADTLTALGENYEKVRRKNLLDSAALNAATELREYTFGLKNGAMSPDGAFTPPPDPVEHYGLYTGKVKEINERMQSELGEELFGTFQKDFQPLALAESFKVREHSLGKQKEAVIADLDRNEDSLAELAAEDGSVVGAAFMDGPVYRKLGEMTQRAVQAGVLGADDAQKRFQRFNAKVSTAQVRRDIRNDPEAALEGLLGESYNGLEVDVRERWTTFAVKEIERRQKVKERETNVTNPVVYTRLRLEAGRGKDISVDAQRMYEAGELKKDDFNTLVTEVESHRSGDSGVPSPYKQATTYVRGMTGGDNVVDFGKAQRQAQALDEFAFWARQNPRATADEMDAQAREIVKRALVVERNELSLIAPKYSPNRLGVTREDLAAAFTRTESEFKAGRMNKKERDREMLNIDTWLDYLSRQEANAALTTKPSKAK